MTKPSQIKRNARKQSGCLRRVYKYLRKEEKRKQEIKGKTYQLNAEFQRIARRDKKSFLNEQCKVIEKNNRTGKSRVHFKKIRDIKEIFHARMGMIKDRNGKDLREAEEIKKKWQEYIELSIQMS